MQVPQKTKTKTTIWSCYTTLGVYSKECKCIHLRYLYSHVYSSTIHNSQITKFMNQPRWPSTNKQTKCDIYEYIHTYIYELLSHKREWNYAICRKMDGTRDHHVKQNKPGWERHISHDPTDMQNLVLKSEW
jgi:hypothetical protein